MCSHGGIIIDPDQDQRWSDHAINVEHKETECIGTFAPMGGKYKRMDPSSDNSTFEGRACKERSCLVGSTGRHAPPGLKIGSPGLIGGGEGG